MVRKPLMRIVLVPAWLVATLGILKLGDAYESVAPCALDGPWG
jgi:hypothetical protein